MSNALQPTALTRVGVVGAGQLARMMGEAAHRVNVALTVLASSPQDSAVATSEVAIFGEPNDEEALDELTRLNDVITFDHELIDLEQIAGLENRGVVVRPSAQALRFAVDKAHQRTTLRDVGINVPRFLVVESSRDPSLASFLDDVGIPVVKAARGGYDGRGVLFPTSLDEALAMIDRLADASTVVVEERLDLRGELAQVMVCDVDGQSLAYPLVATVQANAMCIEVRYPAEVDARVSAEAERIARRVAEVVGAVGIVAIEFFLTDQGLYVNEIALRPHNTGHWTIEGALTNQFANHLLAVSGQPLGPTEPVVAAAVMVNVVGAQRPGSIENARAVEGAYVHDYGKLWRPGRKLGHVTAVGDDPRDAHVRAWQSARAYGTNTKEH